MVTGLVETGGKEVGDDPAVVGDGEVGSVASVGLSVFGVSVDGAYVGDLVTLYAL